MNFIGAGLAIIGAAMDKLLQKRLNQWHVNLKCLDNSVQPCLLG